MDTGIMNGRSANKPRERAFERLREAVLEDIRNGDLAPGDRLASERELSQKFAISRSAVREALRMLETSGVLRFAKGTTGGAFIRESSADGIIRSFRDMIALGRMPLSDMMIVRHTLLMLAIDLTVAHATEEDFVQLSENIDELADAITNGDPIATIGPVMGFNCLLGKASHNLILELVIDTVSAIMADLLFRLGLPTHIDLITPRREILRHLRDRDAQAARQTLSDHLAQTTRYVLQHADLNEADG